MIFSHFNDRHFFIFLWIRFVFYTTAIVVTSKNFVLGVFQSCEPLLRYQ